MLLTSNISHSYKGTQRFDFPDIKCSSSETILILGQSGVGKTTLLHILGGILAPSSGKVHVHEQSIYDLSNTKRDKFRGQNIGIVFQKPHFVAALNAFENLQLAQKMAGKKVQNENIEGILQSLNLDHRKLALPMHMSQGELQRLSIARAVINQPQIILADEPTSALDDKNCEEVVALLDHQAKNLEASLVVVTHDNRLKNYYSQHIELS